MTLLLLLLGCGGGEPTDAFCEEAPPVSWDYWGEGFMIESCQPCHASTAAERNGAPVDVVFDSEADVRRQAAAILAVATGEDPSMPPAGGPTEEDRALLEAWLRCNLEEEP